MPYLPILDVLKAYFEIEEEDREAAIKEKIGEKFFNLDREAEIVPPALHEVLSLKVEDEKYALRFQYARKKGLHVPKSYEVFVQPSDPTRAPVHGVVEYELKRAKVSLPR